jgi:N,N-dimethylformamidase
MIGYCDPLSVAPGERIRFMVSCAPEVARYQANIVRMISGDAQPGGPGRKQDIAAKGIDAVIAGRPQPIQPGSCVVVPYNAAFQMLGSLTVLATIYPTLLDRPRQTLVSLFGAGAGFELFIDQQARLALRLGFGCGSGGNAVFTSGAPLREHRWCRVAATFDQASGVVRLYQEECADGLERARCHVAEHRAAPYGIAVPQGPLIIGASAAEPTHDGPPRTGHFNGRVQRPAVVAAALDPAAMRRLRSAGSVAERAPDTVAVWDFARGIGGDDVHDISATGCHGRAINLPVRAVRGPDWIGDEINWTHAPSQYDAMHFLEDSIQDCGWDADFTWTVPDDCRSGCYAAWLRAGDEEEHIPFFVRPPRGAPLGSTDLGGASPRPRLALLIPTFSYLAYANWRLPFENPVAELIANALPVLGAEDQYLLAHPALGPSLYDAHNDGTSAFYASRLKPNLNMRPGHPWLEQYPADLYLTDWLEAHGFDYDIITDEDLHAEGAALLSRYACVMTGTHPEYVSTAMWDGIDTYLRDGGRLMYMGGNGFVWRVGVRADLPGVIELRRGEASSSIGANMPGEYVMGFTGEYGGLWSKIGRPPQRLVGIGYVAQGFDFSAPYALLAESAAPRAAFIFEGLAPDAVIGDFGLLGHGAAGVEIDRADPALGTPAHALRLASSAGRHTATYKLGNVAGLDAPEVRADLVFFETARGGAVFSVGSMAWAAALSHAGYRNSVSRITGNVLSRFLDPKPFLDQDETGADSPA